MTYRMYQRLNLQKIKSVTKRIDRSIVECDQSTSNESSYYQIDLPDRQSILWCGNTLRNLKKAESCILNMVET